MTKNGTFEIYKGTGAAKFTLLPPRFNDRGFVEKNGAILLEAAPADGKRPDNLPNYNWDRKVVFAIGVPDICLIFDQEDKKLVHDNGGDIKTLQFLPGEGKYEGTYRLMLSVKGGENIMVPISAGEYQILMGLLGRSVPKMIAWE